MNALQAIDFVCTLSSISVLITCVEYLYIRDDFKDGQLLSSLQSVGKKSLYKSIFGYHAFLLTTVISLITSAIIISPIDTEIKVRYLAPIQFLISLYIFQRSHYGADGALQLNMIIFGAISLASYHYTNNLIMIALCFIAAQSILSYVVAGVSKLWGPLWRQGEALGLIMRTKTYGSAWAHHIISSYRLSKNVSRFTVLWECLFPLVLVDALTYPMLSISMSFHIGNAFVMGLNNFLWSFLATYPAIIYISQSNMSELNQLSWFEMIVAIVFVIHIAWTIAAQFNNKIGDFAKTLDRISIIPYWTFFAPTPLVHDYRILCVSRNLDELDDLEWNEIDLKLERRWYHFIWNPEKKSTKSVIDLIQTILVSTEKLDQNQILISKPYIMLSLFIEGKSKEQNTDGKSGFQYLVVKDHGYASSDFEVVFQSAYHTY